MNPFTFLSSLYYLVASRQKSINEVCALNPQADYSAWSFCLFSEIITFNNVVNGRWLTLRTKKYLKLGKYIRWLHVKEEDVRP
jgi:hypothetical protein